MSTARREGGALVVGLLGGVASGKSYVAALLAERGAEVIDADRLAHEQLARPEVIGAIAEALGGEVVRPDGALDRGRIAARVFQDPAAKARLEAIIHPRVGEAIAARLGALAASGPSGAPGEPRPVAVLDVPLLLEVGLDAVCEELCFVEVGEPVRVARARARGWDEGEVRRREASQVPLETKRARATFVIPNEGAVEVTRAAVERFWQERVASRR